MIWSPILVANRGEIAIRIARTTHALGLRTVGLVTPQDRGAAHADVPDVVVPIESYLDVGETLRAAKLTAATAS